jgi:hypothetical protein
LLGLAIVAMNSNSLLRLDMLPWENAELIQWLLWGSIAGMVSIIFAVTGKFKYLFPVWTLVVVVMMIRGYLIQPYTYAGKDPFYQTLVMIAGALLAFFGSLTLFSTRKRHHLK